MLLVALSLTCSFRNSRCFHFLVALILSPTVRQSLLDSGIQAYTTVAIRKDTDQLRLRKATREIRDSSATP